MSEPLSAKEREEMRGAYGDHTKPGRCLNDLEAIEKQHAADLEAQQAAMLKCIREERVSRKTERDTLRAQLEWCESERNAARARCEQQSDQLEQHARLLLEKTARCEQHDAEMRSCNADCNGWTERALVAEKRCEQLERELDLEKDRFADLLARTHDAESRCGQLEAALHLYGQHSPACSGVVRDEEACNCGFEAAIAENSTIASVVLNVEES